MLDTLTRQWKRGAEALSRRELFRRSALLTLPALFRTEVAGAAAAAPSGLRTGLRGAGALGVSNDVYESVGVRPLINARGTFTIISGSLMLPEVRAAMDAASRHHVHLDELMSAIGARLAELTKAEWGMVSCGCAAALTHATAACLAGGNPDLHVRIPNLQGFPRDEVIIPSHSRNVYDAAVRATGVRVVEVSTGEELEAAFGPRTAMVYILAGPEADARSARARSRKRRTAAACRFSSTRPRKFSPFPTCTSRMARRSSPTAEANACAARRVRGCCSAGRTSCRPRGFTARRTTDMRAR
jgi:L-seryl-tRNA(Ser) seleniumtransferase